MSDRPIIFSAPMIRALLDGRKTQTRRVLKHQPPEPCTFNGWDIGPRGNFAHMWHDLGDGNLEVHSPRLPAWRGDRLWVKEAWRACRQMDDIKPSLLSQHEPRRMEADGALIEPACMMIAPGRYRNARFMPRWASRLTLTVTDVRVQRLQEISEADAEAEGCEARVGETWWQGYRDMGHGVPLLHQHSPGDEPPSWMIEPKPAGRSKWADRTAVKDFHTLWNSLHGPDAWDANPWVCAISFDVHRCNIDHMPGRDG